jgi:HPt (histidine-containing phosphotransfer) domain-containing protein
MYDALLADLQEHGADVEGALKRFVGSKDMYGKFLYMIKDDENYGQIAPAFDKGDGDAALTAVHTLKGVSGNLGLSRLYAACSETVLLLRAGKFGEARASCGEIDAAYDEVCRILDSHSAP